MVFFCFKGQFIYKKKDYKLFSPNCLLEDLWRMSKFQNSHWTILWRTADLKHFNLKENEKIIDLLFLVFCYLCCCCCCCCLCFCCCYYCFCCWEKIQLIEQHNSYWNSWPKVNVLQNNYVSFSILYALYQKYQLNQFKIGYHFHDRGSNRIKSHKRNLFIKRLN